MVKRFNDQSRKLILHVYEYFRKQSIEKTDQKVTEEMIVSQNAEVTIFVIPGRNSYKKLDKKEDERMATEEKRYIFSQRYERSNLENRFV
jgi:hypothetical protein